jgi:predicted transcriptional regulator
MSDEKPEDLKKMWAEESVKKSREDQAAKDAAPSEAYDGPSTADDAADKSDWEKLKITAKLRFPDHLALRYALSPVKRLVCVANVLGWDQPKIATASGLSQSTISRYLTDANCAEFIKAFSYHTGSREAREVMDQEVYASIKVVADLRDNPDIQASTRLDAAKFFISMKYGKPTEKSEVKTTDLRSLTESIQKSRVNTSVPPVATFDEDEETVQ